MVSCINNHKLLIFDSTGRSYSLDCHSLPSGRGYGEPLTSWLTPPDGSHFTGMTVYGSQLVLLASSLGYGFIAKIEELVTKNKSGKAVISVPSGASMLPPVLVGDRDQDWIAAGSDQGKLLIFPCGEMPLLGRGKGQKIMHFPVPKKGANRETLRAITVLKPEQSLLIDSGRKFKMKEGDQTNYVSDRAKRGLFLPKGFRSINKLTPVD